MFDSTNGYSGQEGLRRFCVQLPWFCVLLLSEAVALCFTVCSDGALGNLWLFPILSCLPLFGKAVQGLGELWCCRSFVLCPEQFLLQVLHDQNGALRGELQRLRLQLQESRAGPGLPAAGNLQQGSAPTLSAGTKLPLDPSLHGSVGRLLVPELLLLPLLVLGSCGREGGEDGWWGGGRWRRAGFSNLRAADGTCELGSYGRFSVLKVLRGQCNKEEVAPNWVGKFKVSFWLRGVKQPWDWLPDRWGMSIFWGSMDWMELQLACRPALTGLLSATTPLSKSFFSYFCVHRNVRASGAAPRAAAGAEGAAGN